MPKYQLPHVLEAAPGKRARSGARPHVRATLTPFGELLRRYCAQHEVSLYAVADQLGVSRTTTWLWYRCGQLPRRDMLVRLHEVLGIPADELLAATTTREVVPAPPAARKRRQTRREAPGDGWDAWVLSLARIRDPKRRRAVMAAVGVIEQ